VGGARTYFSLQADYRENDHVYLKEYQHYTKILTIYYQQPHSFLPLLFLNSGSARLRMLKS
jgi:hypothetical protein